MALQDNQCPICGRFMEGYDCSTEAGTDWGYRCNNERCRLQIVNSYGIGMTKIFDEIIICN